MPQSIPRLVETINQDVRYALRSLGKVGAWDGRGRLSLTAREV